MKTRKEKYHCLHSRHAASHCGVGVCSGEKKHR